jgi:acyl-CoA reductase-like NAD-dependent aldehyde dehydrogenase
MFGMRLRQIETSMVFIKSSHVNHVWSPFGGLKKSGYGHELSEPS